MPGKQVVLADCLSRNPVETVNGLGKDFEEEINHYVHFVTSYLPASRSPLHKIKDEQERDSIYKIEGILF